MTSNWQLVPVGHVITSVVIIALIVSCASRSYIVFISKCVVPASNQLTLLCNHRIVHLTPMESFSYAVEMLLGVCETIVIFDT